MSRPRLNQSWYDEKLYADFEAYLKAHGFTYMGHGAFRNGWRRGKIVIKVPRSQCGVEDNAIEAYAYNMFRKQSDERGFTYAPARLLSNACLMMAYVEPVDWDKEEVRPAWIHYIDAYQCGKFNGRIVAYDSACDASHIEKVAWQWAGIPMEEPKPKRVAAGSEEDIEFAYKNYWGD